MMNHIVVKELQNRGHEPVLGPNGLKLEGFYKAGSLDLSLSQEDPEVIICTQRYGDMHEIRTFDDLVRIHFSWWMKSRSRAEFWQQPDEKWVDDYIRLELVTVTMVKVYHPKD